MKDYLKVTENYFKSYTDEETFNKIVMYPTLVEMWEHCEKEYQNKSAILDEREYSYKELGEDIAKYRGVLVNNGVKKGDKVCVLVPSTYDFAKIFFAIETLGAVAVLLPVQLDEKTIFGCTQKFNAKTIVYHDSLSQKVELSASLGIKTISTKEEADKVPANKVEPSDEAVIIFTGGNHF